MRIVFYWLILSAAGFGAASAVDSAIRRLFAPVAPVDLPRQATGYLDMPESAAKGRHLGPEILGRPRHPVFRFPGAVPLLDSGLLDRQSLMLLHTYPFMADVVAQQAVPRNPRAALPDYFDPSATGVTNG